MPNIQEIINLQRNYFSEGKTLKVHFRINALKKLKGTIRGYEKEILDALKKDLNKSPFESYATEIGIILEEINHAIRNISKWSRIKHVKTPLTQFKSKSFIIPEPYGVVLIMSPWNYPFQLTFAPIIGAIAAGNCVVAKPSAYSPATSAIIAQIVEASFDKKYIAVIEGGREANKELLQHKYDYIFFTGSVNVGRMVMEAASRYLTPITLELGGKNPCIVEKDANIDISARRIVWGKTLNSGQTCVAPDYLLVHKDVKTKLLAAMKKYIIEFYSDKPCDNDEYPRIVNEKHFNRLTNLLKDVEITVGGDSNPTTSQISPTIINNVKWDDQIMQDEIFGPILPVIEYDDLSQVIDEVKRRPKPLALYLFTRSPKIEGRVLKTISFGGGCINDTVVHVATSRMPFGGVGESGIGCYHGKWSFETFSHKKSVLKKSLGIDLKIRYAPYGGKINILKKFMK